MSFPLRLPHLFLMAALLWAGCGSTTHVTTTFVDPEYQARAFSKVAVLAITESAEARQLAEDKTVAALKARGVPAHQGVAVFPVGEDLNQETRESAGAKLQAAGFDGVLVMRLVRSNYVPAEMPGADNHPYYNSFDSYYTTTKKQSVPYGSQPLTLVVVVEFNYYDVKTLGLLWSARSHTEDESTGTAVIKAFTEPMVDKLMASGLILQE